MIATAVVTGSTISPELGGAGPEFVVEGDEYHNAFFDRRPKFLRYRPRLAVLTSVELDHVELGPMKYDGAVTLFGFHAPAPSGCTRGHDTEKR